MIKVGIIGGAGYTAGELIRILINHSETELVFVHSNSQAGQPLSSIHQDLEGDTSLKFTNEINQDIDVAFLCLGHGKSVAFLEQNPLSEKTKIIDLSQDFRLGKNSTFQAREFVYGLPELFREKVIDAQNIANPGCFATAIQLALLPAAAQAWLPDEVHIHAITGSTGAGQAPTATTHYSWRNNNVSVYKAFKHQHLHEIGESLNSLQTITGTALNFIPIRGNFTRGILATAYMNCAESLETVKDAYQSYYKDAAFTHVSAQPLHLKQVVNSNKCLVHVDKQGDKILITSIIDNLLKGASGQATQNMNLMFGLPENAGLKLKSSMH